MNIMNFIKFFTKKLSFAFLAGFLAFGIPASVNAGFFSFIGDMFEKNVQIVGEEKETNSQTAALLHAALNVDPNPAKGGGDIIIVGGTALLPESGPSGTLADIEENEQTSDQISLYIVREGDSLSQIAKMFGVTTNTIIWANDIKRGDFVNVGQTLIILPITGVRYAVVKGDTLQSITKKYKGDLEEILEYNGLSENSQLAIGDIVVIPDGEMSMPKYSSSGTQVRGTNVPSYSGYYIRPISGGTKSQGLHGYNAVDIAAPYGTPVFAAASGDVIISKNSGWNGGYGNYVVIRHPNGTQTLYSHNSRNIVSAGQHVVKGQIIGYVGSTGRSTGNHVHFEVRGARNPF
ncbi:peptidoglycan DD-metalloendopeptidase family protein [Patescibacteria group bacterium]